MITPRNTATPSSQTPALGFSQATLASQRQNNELLAKVLDELVKVRVCKMLLYLTAQRPAQDSGEFEHFCGIQAREDREQSRQSDNIVDKIKSEGVAATLRARRLLANSSMFPDDSDFHDLVSSSGLAV